MIFTMETTCTDLVRALSAALAVRQISIPPEPTVTIAGGAGEKHSLKSPMRREKLNEFRGKS